MSISPCRRGSTAGEEEDLQVEEADLEVEEEDGDGEEDKHHRHRVPPAAVAGSRTEEYTGGTRRRHAHDLTARPSGRRKKVTRARRGRRRAIHGDRELIYRRDVWGKRATDLASRAAASARRKFHRPARATPPPPEIAPRAPRAAELWRNEP